MREDVRETLPVRGNFYNLLHTLFEKKEEAHILYDDNGITRANGMITLLSGNNDSGYLMLNDSIRINLSDIVAVNGTFASDYSEC